MINDRTLYQTLSDIVNAMNEISIKEDRTCIPLSRIKEETNLPLGELRKVMKEAEKMGKIFSCQDLGMNERGYVVVNQQMNLTIYRKETLRPIEVTKDYVVVEYKMNEKFVNMSLDYINRINISFYGDIVWNKEFYYFDSTGNKIKKLLEKDLCPNDICVFTIPLLKPVPPRSIISFGYITYYYLYPKEDYFIFEIPFPTLKLLIDVDTTILDVYNVRFTMNVDPTSYSVSRKSNKFKLESKNLSSPLEIILNMHINNL